MFLMLAVLRFHSCETFEQIQPKRTKQQNKVMIQQKVTGSLVRVRLRRRSACRSASHEL